MIFILLPFLTDALNVTGHARTDVKGRFWDETYDCEGKNVEIRLQFTYYTVYSYTVYSYTVCKLNSLSVCQGLKHVTTSIQDFPFGPNENGPHDNEDEANYCEAFERWRQECLGQDLKSPNISCRTFLSIYLVKNGGSENEIILIRTFWTSHGLMV